MENKTKAEKESEAIASPRWRMKAFSVPQLLAFVVIATLTPMVILGTVALLLWDTNERKADVARLDQHALSLSQAVDNDVRSYREIVEGLATSPDLRNGRTEAFWRYAQGLASHVGGHFAVVDMNMRQLVNTGLPIGSQLPLTQSTETVQKVLATRSLLITDFETRSASGQTQFAIMVPVDHNGQAGNVLAYAPPAHTIQKVLMQAYRPEGWLAAVLDRNGTIIARTHEYQEFFGRPANPDFFARIREPVGSIESTDLQGRVSMTAWQTTRNGWKVLVWAPKEILEQRTRIAVRALALAALATILFSILAFWLASRIIRGPARRLVEAARSLGDGQLVHFTPTNMVEANAIGASLSEASALIHRRESDLLASQAHTNLIMRELSHRSKNLLALVQAIARQSARASTNFADFQPRFIERLQSLSMSHDLLVKTDWTSVPMRDLLSVQMRTFIDKPHQRLKIVGEHLMLKPEAAQQLGMVFHELASNAVKHGSLSTPSGGVAVEWRIEDHPTPTLVLTWREEGGPPVSSPTSRGFGTTIIEKLIPQSLHGEAHVTWDKEGFCWKLVAPMSSIARAGKYSTAQRGG